MPPANLKQNRLDRAAAAKAKKQEWNRMAEPLLEEGDNKKEVANIIVERTGANYNTVYRALKRPK